MSYRYNRHQQTFGFGDRSHDPPVVHHHTQYTYNFTFVNTQPASYQPFPLPPPYITPLQPMYGTPYAQAQCVGPPQPLLQGGFDRAPSGQYNGDSENQEVRRLVEDVEQPQHQASSARSSQSRASRPQPQRSRRHRHQSARNRMRAQTPAVPQAVTQPDIMRPYEVEEAPDAAVYHQSKRRRVLVTTPSAPAAPRPVPQQGQSDVEMDQDEEVRYLPARTEGDKSVLRVTNHLLQHIRGGARD